MKTNTVIVLKLDTCRFLTSYKPEVEGQIVHLTDSLDSFDKLAPGKALEVFNKQVAKADKLAADVTDTVARSELCQLVKDNIADVEVGLPSAKKEPAGPRGGKSSKGKATAEKKKPAGNKRGRASAFAGTKLTKSDTYNGHESSRRSKTYASIVNGMLFETFCANGLNVQDLRILVNDGHVKAA